MGMHAEWEGVLKLVVSEGAAAGTQREVFVFGAVKGVKKRAS